MKCACPACGRTTGVEMHLLDFFTRCERCGVLLRAREEGEGVRVTAEVVPVGKVREAMANANGTLAALLCRPAVLRMPEGAKADHAVATGRWTPGKGTALRRAALRHHHRMLGIVGACGMGLVILIGVGVVVLKARGGFGPRGAVAGEIRMTKHE